jgi:ribonuclease HI
MEAIKAEAKVRKKVNVITINTDASFHPDHNVGGYAFYIRCDLFKITKAGGFKIQPKNSKEAEMMCIGNAISTLLAQKELPEARWLIINSDCKYGYEEIRQGKRGIGKKINVMWQKLILRLGSAKNIFRHVKAHSGKDDARSFVNEWCDKEAKKWMRKCVAEIQLEGR